MGYGKSVLRGKFIALNVYIRKGVIYKMNNLISTLILEKKEKIKSKQQNKDLIKKVSKYQWVWKQENNKINQT